MASKPRHRLVSATDLTRAGNSSFPNQGAKHRIASILAKFMPELTRIFRATETEQPDTRETGKSGWRGYLF